MGHNLQENLLEIEEVLPKYVLNRLDLLRLFDKFMHFPIAEVVD